MMSLIVAALIIRCSSHNLSAVPATSAVTTSVQGGLWNSALDGGSVERPCSPASAGAAKWKLPHVEPIGSATGQRKPPPVGGGIDNLTRPSIQLIPVDIVWRISSLDLFAKLPSHHERYARDG